MRSLQKGVQMQVRKYQATIRHDKGIIKLKVASLSGRSGAIKQIMAHEGCPESAIEKLKKIGKKKRK